MSTTTTTRPYRITEHGRTLATASTLRRAQAAVARRIASDVENRLLLLIDTRTGHGFLCRNAGLTISYTPARGLSAVA